MLMIGRGMVTDPGLARAIKGEGASHRTVTWQYLLPFIADFWRIVCSRLERRQQAGRLKQWLNFLRRRYPEAEVAYMELRTVNDPAAIDAWLVNHEKINLRVDFSSKMAILDGRRQWPHLTTP
jgi:tRNA-dihydrouridine synthase C